MTGLGLLALELPEIESADINPIRVCGDTVKAVDALLVTARQRDARMAAPAG